MELQHAAAVLETTREILMDGKAEKEAPIPMQDNVLEAFRNGCLLDLRVRLAMELLAHSPSLVDVVLTPDPRELAVKALDVATELFSIAQERGLVKPLGEIDEHLEAHIRRQVTYQLMTAKEQKRQGEEAGRIAQAVHGAFRGN